MFLSMVCAPNEGRMALLIGRVLTRDSMSRQVAPKTGCISFGRSRSGNLSEADRLRRGLLAHFVSPFMRDEARVEDLEKAVRISI